MNPVDGRFRHPCVIPRSLITSISFNCVIVALQNHLNIQMNILGKDNVNHEHQGSRWVHKSYSSLWSLACDKILCSVSLYAKISPDNKFDLRQGRIINVDYESVRSFLLSCVLILFILDRLIMMEIQLKITQIRR